MGTALPFNRSIVVSVYGQNLILQAFIDHVTVVKIFDSHTGDHVAIMVTSYRKFRLSHKEPTGNVRSQNDYYIYPGIARNILSVYFIC